MKLKHDCPQPAKFGSAEPLWKTATVNFLKAVRDVGLALKQFDTGALRPPFLPCEGMSLTSFVEQNCRTKVMFRFGSKSSRAFRERCWRKRAFPSFLSGENELTEIC